MLLDDRPADRQAKPESLLIGRREGLEQPVCYRCGQAEPGIGDGDANRVHTLGSGADRQFANLAGRHRLQGIADQVDENLLDLNRGDEDGVGGAVQLEDGSLDGTMAVGTAPRHRLLEQATQAFDALLDLAARDELAKRPDDATGPDRLGGGFAERLADQLKRLGRRVSEHLVRRFEVVGDGRQRLVQFMGERRRQRAHRAQPRHLDQLGLKVLDPPLAPATFGQVADEGGEQPLAAADRLADRKLDRKCRSILAQSGLAAREANDVIVTIDQELRRRPDAPVAIMLRHQHVETAPEHVGFGIAEQPFGRRAERRDDAHGIDDDHRFGNRREDRPKMVLETPDRRLGGLLVGNIAHDLAETAQLAAVIEQRRDRYARKEFRSVLAQSPAFLFDAAERMGARQIVLGLAGGDFVGRIEGGKNAARRCRLRASP